MRIKRSLFPVLALVILLVSVVGCNSPAVSPIDLVPQDAQFIANVKLSQLINDQDFRNAYDNAEKPPDQPQTIDAGLDMVVEETGIDLRDFSQCLLFGKLDNLDQSD